VEQLITLAMALRGSESEHPLSDKNTHAPAAALLDKEQGSRVARVVASYDRIGDVRFVYCHFGWASKHVTWCRTLRAVQGWALLRCRMWQKEIADGANESSVHAPWRGRMNRQRQPC